MEMKIKTLLQRHASHVGKNETTDVMGILRYCVLALSALPFTKKTVMWVLHKGYTCTQISSVCVCVCACVCVCV